MIKSKYLIVLFIVLLSSCNSINNKSNKFTNKLGSEDLFKKTIVESEFFKIDATIDNVIDSKKGFCIVIPANSLINRKGEMVIDSLEIEFAAATTLDDLILSNLIYSDSTNNLNTQQAFFINASRNGEKLLINAEEPIYIELASENEIYLHKGLRHKNGDMKWDSTISHVDYLVNLPFDYLNFYPPQFEITVEKGLPYKNHEIVSKKLLDSLYYSFAPELDKNGYLTWNFRFLAINVMGMLNAFIPQEEYEADTVATDSTPISKCGINPASIKAIRKKKFEKTLIATREFEQRLKVIFETCEPKVLEVYINNLDKNLWELDLLAADIIGKDNKSYERFLKFASYKQTNIKLSERKAKKLAEYYSNQKESIDKQISQNRKELFESKKKKEKLSEKKINAYKELLEKRHAFRNNKFGYELTEFGWYNATTKKHVNQLKTFILNVKVPNGNSYERVYTYAVNENINSIYSMLSSDNIHFDKVYKEDSFMLINEKHNFKIIGIGFNAEQAGLGVKQFSVDSIVNVEIELSNVDLKELKKQLRQYTFGYRKENKIMVDLEYQAFIYKEKKRKKKALQEALYINSLRKVVFSCCPVSDNYFEYMYSLGGN